MSDDQSPYSVTLHSDRINWGVIGPSGQSFPVRSLTTAEAMAAAMNAAFHAGCKERERLVMIADSARAQSERLAKRARALSLGAAELQLHIGEIRAQHIEASKMLAYVTPEAFGNVCAIVESADALVKAVAAGENQAEIFSRIEWLVSWVESSKETLRKLSIGDVEAIAAQPDSDPVIAALTKRVDVWRDEMLARLVAHKGRGGPDGWERDTPESLLVRVCEEFADLGAAVSRGDVAETRKQAANVANMAMMVADAVLVFGGRACGTPGCDTVFDGGDGRAICQECDLAPDSDEWPGPEEILPEVDHG